MTRHFKQNISVKISTFSAAAEFFRQTGQKGLPGVGNTQILPQCRPHVRLPAVLIVD